MCERVRERERARARARASDREREREIHVFLSEREREREREREIHVFFVREKQRFKCQGKCGKTSKKPTLVLVADKCTYIFFNFFCQGKRGKISKSLRGHECLLRTSVFIFSEL